MTLPVFLVEEFTHTRSGCYQFPAPVIRAVSVFDGCALLERGKPADWSDVPTQERMLDLMTEHCTRIFEHKWIQIDEGNKVMRCPPKLSMHPLILTKEHQDRPHAPWAGLIVLFDRNGNFRETATSDRKELLEWSARQVAERWEAETGCETSGISGRSEFRPLLPIIEAACPPQNVLYQWPKGRLYSAHLLKDPGTFNALIPHLMQILPQSYLQSDTARVDKMQSPARL